MVKEKTLVSILLVLSIGLLIVSAYLNYVHTQLKPGNLVCTYAPGITCDEVLVTPYAYIMGISDATFGLVGGIILTMLTLGRLLYLDQAFSRRLNWYIWAFALLGWGFSFWLTLLEFFVIFKLCPFCFTAFIISCNLLVASIMNIRLFGVDPVRDNRTRLRRSRAGIGTDDENTPVVRKFKGI